jgi:hypothetical protein
MFKECRRQVKSEKSSPVKMNENKNTTRVVWKNKVIDILKYHREAREKVEESGQLGLRFQ